MVNMGVGGNDVVDLAGLEAQGVIVVLVPALLQTAVDQNLFASHFQTVAASGNGMGRTEERQFHSSASFN